MRSRLRCRLTRVDFAAICVFAAVWIYYIWMVRYGHGSADESYFITTAQRFLYGDRPFVDEWFPGQLCCVFLCLPYKLFVAIRGGTAGIFLFMRYLFLAANACFYWIAYVHLREYRWHALIASLLLCIYIPGTIFSCCYYTMAIRLLMAACLLLFREKQTPLSLLTAGVLLSCAVVNQYGFALLYVGYTVLVWVRFHRQKKGNRFLDDYAFCLSVRSWKYLSLSVFVCACVFCGWLLCRSGLRDILTALPYMLTDPEYDYSAQGRAWGVIFRKLKHTASMFGAYCWIPALLIVALSAAYACGAFRGRRDTARKLLFCFACPVWIVSCVPMIRFLLSSVNDVNIPDEFYTVYSAPMLWFGLTCYLLCEHKNKRLFPFWIVGLSASLCVDFLSDVAFSIGSPIACIADLVFFTDLLRELRAENASSKKQTTDMIRRRKQIRRLDFSVRWLSRSVCAGFAVWFAFAFFMENTAFLEHYIFDKPLFVLSHRCEEGPWQHLRCSEEYGTVYDEMIADIDTIKEKKPESLLVCGKQPELYVHAELPFATCFSCPDTDLPVHVSRNVLYWKLHPDRTPACIYVPFDRKYVTSAEQSVFVSDTLQKTRACFDPICDYTIEQGQSGFILCVTNWHLHAETTEK